MEMLSATSFQPYRRTIKDVNLFNLRKLRSIQIGTFNNLPHLRTIYISGATQLKALKPQLFSTKIFNLKIIRIVHSGLTHVPNFTNLRTRGILHTVDLENNEIEYIPSHTFQIRAEEVILSYNSIEVIDKEAFSGSEIAKLVIKGNPTLTRIHPRAFDELESLRFLYSLLVEEFYTGAAPMLWYYPRPDAIAPDLAGPLLLIQLHDLVSGDFILQRDLSSTSITELPTTGLSSLEVLKIENTRSLKVFPSVFNFEHMKEAYLTYPYHCCAFKYPDTHAPEEFARIKAYNELIDRECSQQSQNPNRTRRSQSKTFSDYSGIWGPVIQLANRSTVSPIDRWNDEWFHEAVDKPSVKMSCGYKVQSSFRNLTCSPRPDAFNPCEDLMGNWTLRVLVWIVAIFSMVGNLAVLVVLVSSRFRMTVTKFLMCNLALADMFMAIYLMIIAAMDARSIGDYFNHAIDWQNGRGCRLAGFLTVLSSELSVFTLAVITCERWYTITYAIHLNRRMKIRMAAYIMACGWTYSIIMATLPLAGVSSYSKTSICLPLESRNPKDIGYLFFLLMFNGLAFWMICMCYSRMYWSIRNGHEMAHTHSDLTVAKRMAMLVFTDFACWAPITFFGITALAGYPLIDVSKTKILLVLFYPLNSCANPYLYALLTQQYQRDLFTLLSRFGLCTERAARYRAPVGVSPRRRADATTVAGAAAALTAGTEPAAQEAARIPGHRGSLQTTMTSVDSSNPGSGRLSASAIRERLAAIELMPITVDTEEEGCQRDEKPIKGLLTTVL